MSTITLSNAALTNESGAALTFTPEPERTGVWTVKVLNRTTHAVIATLENANADWVEKVINDVWTAEFHMHPLDPDATQLAPELLVEREVQFWRDDRCEFWGVPVQARASLNRVTFSCVGLLWYYARRYFGPIRDHFGTNTDFEAGTAGWTAVGCTFSASTEWRALGTQSAKLVCGTEGADAFITQSHTTTTPSWSPVFFAFKAAFHLKDDGWIGPALEERGLYLEVRDSGGGLVGEPVWEPLTNATPRDHHRPVRLETGISVPAGMTNAQVVRRIYSPGGTIYVDATDIAREESVGSPVIGEAADLIMKRFHEYAQDPAWGKSNEDIGWASSPGSYPIRIDIRQFYDHANILEAMRDYPKRGDLDYEMVWPPTTADSRTLRVWAGAKGVLKAGSPIELGVNVVGDFSYDVNGSAVTTAARVLGQGEGADREIGHAVDTSELDGLVLESVESAPLEAPIDALQGLADEDLSSAKAPVRVPEFTVAADEVLPAVELGDTVPVTVNYGWVQEATNRRVVKIRIDCTNDAATLGFN